MSGQSVMVAILATTGRFSFSTTARTSTLWKVSVSGFIQRDSIVGSGGSRRMNAHRSEVREYSHMHDGGVSRATVEGQIEDAPR